MNLIVDIGNTRAKMALMECGEVVAEQSADRFLEAMIRTLIAGREITGAIVSSTRDDGAEVAGLVRRYVPHTVLFDAGTAVPIANDYLMPATLGRDRLAAAVGVVARCPGRNVLIVDLGTAITIDLVTADATFRGGVISPGVQTRFRALHDYTARLPLCAPAEVEGLQGRSTDEAVRLGVMNSVAFEIEGYIARMSEKIDDLCVIFTGGDAKYFVKRIKNTIFANWNPVLYGLDRILEYNVSEEYLD